MRAREWLSINVDPQWRERLRHLEGKERTEFLRSWQRSLSQAQLIGVSWPKEWGGLGLGPDAEIAIGEEFARIGAPPLLSMSGIYLVGPALLKFGTESQQNRLLGKILGAEEVWCQGYSEPEAGSDLKNLRTSAVATDEGFLINGSKIWTSMADIADHCLLLARTGSGPTREAFTMFLVPMSTPGIAVKPILDLLGRAEFNEVHFENVQVGKDALLGDFGSGWHVALDILSFERKMPTRGRALWIETVLRDLVQLGKSAEHLRDSDLRNISSAITSLYVYRAMRRANSQVGHHRPEESTGFASIEKLQWDETLVQAYRAAEKILGAGMAFTDLDDGLDWMNRYLDAPSYSIAGGTTEMQRNTIARNLLSLPRE